MMPAGELYTTLQLGTIGGLSGPTLWRATGSGFRVAKYVIAPTKGYNPHSEVAIHAFLIVNPAAWAKLPSDLSTIICTACYAAYWYGTGVATRLNREFGQKWLDASAAIIELTGRIWEDNRGRCGATCRVR